MTSEQRVRRVPPRFLVGVLFVAAAAGRFGAEGGAVPDDVVLRVGETVTGWVSAASPLVQSPGLVAGYSDGPVRGARVVLEVQEAGSVTIDLRSHSFDAYLVVERESGEVVAEDDDGWVATHSRIVIRGEPARYALWACALHGGAGSFEIQVRAGEAPALVGAARGEAEIEDARAHVRALESDGSDTAEVGEALDRLGTLLWQAGRYEEAAPVMSRALEIARARFGDDDLRTARARYQLAAQYLGLGRSADAEPLLVQALEIRDARGVDLPDTVQLLNTLAGMLESQGRLDEAVRRYGRSLEILESALGPDRIEVAYGQLRLAGVYEALGRYAEAEPLYVRALEITEAGSDPARPGVATARTGLANLYRVQGRYVEAEPLYVRALEVMEAVQGPNHLHTATGLDNLGSLYQSLDRYEEAEPLHLRALSIREAALGSSHLETARSLHNLAGVYRSQGRYAEAESLLVRVLSIRESALGSVHSETATVLASLAGVYRSQGRSAEAESLLVRSLSIRESALGPEHPSTAASLADLASLYRSVGRHDEAVPLCRRALSIRERVLGAEHPSTATSLEELALVLRLQGRYAEAEPLYLRALGIREARRGRDHFAVATTWNGLANLYQSQGRRDEAEPLYLRALEIKESVLGPDHPSTATARNDLASLYWSWGRHADAESLYLRARASWESALGPDHPRVADVLNNLAGLYGSQGRHGEAEPLYLRALEIRRSGQGPAHPTTAAILNNLAGLYWSQGRRAEATVRYVEALRIRESVLGETHPDTVQTLGSLAQLHLTEGRHAEALAWALRALEGGESWVVRELLRTPTGARLSIAASRWDDVDLALTAWRAHRGPHPTLDLVYRRITGWKGVALRATTRLARTIVSMREDPEVQALRSALAALDGRLSVLAYAEHIDDPSGHRSRLTELRQERRRTEQELLARLGLDPDVESTDGAELARLLPERSAVLDFLVHRPWLPGVGEDGRAIRGSRWSDSRLLCFVTVAGAAGPVLVDLGSTVALRDATDAWRRGLTQGRRGAQAEVEDGRTSPAQRLRELLLAPLLEVLPPETTCLFVIPDDVVAEIPLGAIPLGPDRFLLQLVDVVHATDPVTLRDLLRTPAGPIAAAPSTLFAVGGVDYDVRSDVPSGEAPATRPTAPRRDGGAGFSRTWGPLAGTSIEVDGLAKQAITTWPDATSPRLLKSTAATEEAVKSEAPGHAILHFATHGFFQREGLESLWQAALERAHDDLQPRGLGAMSAMFDRPRDEDPFAGTPALDGEEPGMLAGLVFAGANLDPSLEPDRDDGILTATEVSSLDLSACRLAVLSACQTSAGVGQSGEGLQSLRRAFHEAGADTVIASLWKVDDEATQRLMLRFYEELWTNGRGAGEALRRAQLALMRETNDPYQWAAFTLSGEWR